jgi:putative inorganic carbon (hco3(-)) transporter
MAFVLAALLVLSPTYLIRFEVGGLPLNMLEIAIAVFLLILVTWIIYSKQITEFLKFIKDQPPSILAAAGLFILAGLISTIISPDLRHASGMFLTLFILPVICYLPAKFILRSEESRIIFIYTITVMIIVASVYGILQYFTLLGLPETWWGNSIEPKRVLSFFAHPNAFALWLTPLLAFLIPITVTEKKRQTRILYSSAVILGFMALILSGARGGWLGFMAAVGVYILFSRNKKATHTLISCAVLAAVIIAAVPNLRYRVILPFKGEKSAVSRFSLWHTANKMIFDSPILGQGLYSYQTNFEKYNTDPGLAPINHPHNIFLTLWLETGLLGLLSFVYIFLYSGYTSFKRRMLAPNFGILLFLIALLFHGLTDSPYIINHLALTYWLILGLAE